MDYLEEYCTDRTGTGATKEDMERGNVWIILYFNNFFINI